MKKYNNSLEGKLIVVNNFSFSTGKLDHAWNTGRICIIIYSDDDYEYVLPITHSIKNKYRNEYFYINKNNFSEFYDSRYKEYVLSNKNKLSSKNNYDTKGYINLREVYKLPIVYRDEIGKINYRTYKIIKDRLERIQKNKQIEDEKSIKF